MHPPPRVVIENVKPAVNDGRFPVKRVVGDSVEITAVRTVLAGARL